MSADGAKGGGAGAAHDSELIIAWSPVYLPDWDAAPQAYVDAGVLAPGRTRRLAKVTEPRHGFKAYLGVQHFEPARWNLPGEPTAKFFASFFVAGRTVALRTFPTLSDALAAVRTFANSLASR